MGAEVGATCSLFPFSQGMNSFLHSTHRDSIALQASAIASTPNLNNLLSADTGAHYDQLITIDLSSLEPCINGPHTPDLSTPVSKFAKAVEGNGWPTTLSSSLIGSCTNSSYEDMTRAENLVKQAEAAGLKPVVDLFVTPGSEQIRATLERDTTLSTFEEAGGVILANACGAYQTLFE
jgi:homoaconitase